MDYLKRVIFYATNLMVALLMLVSCSSDNVGDAIEPEVAKPIKVKLFTRGTRAREINDLSNILNLLDVHIYRTVNGKWQDIARAASGSPLFTFSDDGTLTLMDYQDPNTLATWPSDGSPLRFIVSYCGNSSVYYKQGYFYDANGGPTTYCGIDTIKAQVDEISYVDVLAGYASATSHTVPANGLTIELKHIFAQGEFEVKAPSGTEEYIYQVESIKLRTHGNDYLEAEYGISDTPTWDVAPAKYNLSPTDMTGPVLVTGENITTTSTYTKESSFYVPATYSMEINYSVYEPATKTYVEGDETNHVQAHATIDLVQGEKRVFNITLPAPGSSANARVLSGVTMY